VIVQDMKLARVIWFNPDPKKRSADLDLNRIMAWANVPRASTLIKRVLNGERLVLELTERALGVEVVRSKPTHVRVYDYVFETKEEQHLVSRKDEKATVYDTANGTRLTRLHHRIWRHLQQGAKVRWEQSTAKTEA